MKGQRSIFDPFLEGVDLNQGLNSSSDESDDWNVLSPIERRLLNNDLSSELNFNCVNRNNHQNHNFRSFSNWDVGESSSRASLQQDQTSNESPTVGVQNSASNHIPMNVNLNIGYGSTNHDDGDDDGDDDGMPLPFIDLYKTEDERGPASSLGNWGLSCKRKTLEGSTSTQPVIGGSSNSLNISLGSVNPVAVDRHEPPNTRIGDTNNNVLLVANTNRRQTISAFHQSSTRQVSVNEFLDQTSSNLTNQQPPITPRSGPNYHWGNNIASSSLRNSVRYHNFVPLPEPRNLVQDPTNWSLATGSTTTSGGAVTTAASTRNVGGSRSFNVVRNQNNPTTQSQQRSTDVPPWTLFPEVESGAQRRNFTGASSSSSSTLEDNQRHHIQPFSRSALLMEVAGDDWHALAADIEGRQRLVSEIRQVLNAMRRGENLRAEDYMLIDPFINEVAELHDRHRDMRLDVDNMSYEELLALEERIGNVNTGLSEEVILKSLKQRKHIAFMAISTQNSEPCCICQEEYVRGENIGSLDCGHDFHTDCIKQWLAQKNLCPICKMTGLKNL